MKTLVTLVVAVLIGLVVCFWPQDVEPPPPFMKMGRLVVVFVPVIPIEVAPVTSDVVEPLPQSAQQYGAPAWEKARATLDLEREILVNTPPGEERD